MLGGERRCLWLRCGRRRRAVRGLGPWSPVDMRSGVCVCAGGVLWAGHEACLPYWSLREPLPTAAGRGRPLTRARLSRPPTARRDRPATPLRPCSNSVACAVRCPRCSVVSCASHRRAEVPKSPPSSATITYVSMYEHHTWYSFDVAKS